MICRVTGSLGRLVALVSCDMIRTRPCSLGRSLLSCTRVWCATGTVRAWDSGKRFGFIDDDETGHSMFVHADDCIFADPGERRTSIARGVRVEYTVACDSNDERRRCLRVTLAGGASLPPGPFVLPAAQQQRPASRLALAVGQEAGAPGCKHFRLAGLQRLSGTVVRIAGTYGFVNLDAVVSSEAGRTSVADHAFFHVSDVVPGTTVKIGDKGCLDIVLRVTKHGKKIRAVNVTHTHDQNR